MFSTRTFDFLQQLAGHNDREWFKAHQQEYEDVVRTPALSLITTLAPSVQTFSPRILAVAKKVGGSLMRVQRDTRFAHDKSPYKTNIGIQFRHFQGKDVHAPGLYLHIANDECFLAAGIWHPESKALNAIRHCIDENPNAYQKALQTLQKADFVMDGESLQRPPRGFSADHPLLTELKRKDFIAVKTISKDRVLSADFPEWLMSQWQACKPLMAYLCFALELDF
ncbi:DUF2461 domain-containing protein [Pseudoalteromonas fenneropenaei]|uniref:DUF2461 domain-containing protein n=1 Tax=Pseudoalteromonas fenneropenaei TaxID=1737459 RepID=A0ABV7CJT4_9GAMM